MPTDRSVVSGELVKGRNSFASKVDLCFVSLDDLIPLIRESLAHGQDVRFYPRGVSMLPMLRQGVDSVVLSPVRGPLSRYDIPLYQRDDGAYVLHRVTTVRSFSEGSRVRVEYDCSGDHQFAIERSIRHEQVIAVVSGFYRDDRYVPVTNLRYRVYSRAICHTRRLRHLRWQIIRCFMRRKHTCSKGAHE